MDGWMAKRKMLQLTESFAKRQNYKHVVKEKILLRQKLCRKTHKKKYIYINLETHMVVNNTKCPWPMHRKFT